MYLLLLLVMKLFSVPDAYQLIEKLKQVGKRKVTNSSLRIEY